MLFIYFLKCEVPLAFWGWVLLFYLLTNGAVHFPFVGLVKSTGWWGRYILPLIVSWILGCGKKNKEQPDE